MRRRVSAIAHLASLARAPRTFSRPGTVAALLLAIGCSAAPEPGGAQQVFQNEYTADGTLAERTAYRVAADGSGVRHGARRAWYEDGALRDEEYYVDGVLHGLQTSWWPDGTLAGVRTFENGVPDGTHFQWHPNGQLLGDVEYCHGRRVGLMHVWHLGGGLHVVGHWHSDIELTAFCFRYDGSWEWAGSRVCGVKDGVWIYWNDTGQVERVENWKDGVILNGPSDDDSENEPATVPGVHHDSARHPLHSIGEILSDLLAPRKPGTDVAMCAAPTADASDEVEQAEARERSCSGTTAAAPSRLLDPRPAARVNGHAAQGVTAARSKIDGCIGGTSWRRRVPGS